jgi:hypothetical protein
MTHLLGVGVELLRFKITKKTSLTISSYYTIEWALSHNELQFFKTKIVCFCSQREKAETIKQSCKIANTFQLEERKKKNILWKTLIQAKNWSCQKSRTIFGKKKHFKRIIIFSWGYHPAFKKPPFIFPTYVQYCTLCTILNFVNLYFTISRQKVNKKSNCKSHIALQTQAHEADLVGL